MFNQQNIRGQWKPRENQKIPKGDWSVWLIMAGRGFGKTRTGAETIKELVGTGKYKHIAIIGKSLVETRAIMIEGIAGILGQDYDEAKYYSSKRIIEWENGAKGYIVSGDNIESLRGLQFDLVWIDEFAKFRDPETFWEQLSFTMRIGSDPKCIITTTPRPLEILKNISKDDKTHLTTGSTFENEEHLGDKFIKAMKAKFKGTRLGDQELYGKLIFEIENPLWKKDFIQHKKIDLEDMQKIVIGVDPAVSNNQNSDETGIIVAGLGKDENIYVIDDVSIKANTTDWVKTVIHSCCKYKADIVVAEVNNGGDLVGQMIKCQNNFIPYRSVRAIRGKVARAEPIALLYESSQVYHFQEFKKLEKQMLSMSYRENLTKSPDRLDALVWAINEIKETKNRHIGNDFISVI